MGIISSTPLHQDSPLLRLPAEIKNRVFELVIPTNTTVILRAQAADDADRKRYIFRPLPLALLLTCRELRAEFTTMYYATNTFLIFDTMFQPQSLARDVATRLGKASQIRRVKVMHRRPAHHGNLLGRRRALRCRVLRPRVRKSRGQRRRDRTARRLGLEREGDAGQRVR